MEHFSAALTEMWRTRVQARGDKRYRFPAVAARRDIKAAAPEVADRLLQEPTINADCNKLHVRLDSWTTFYISSERALSKDGTKGPSLYLSVFSLFNKNLFFSFLN